MDQQNSRYQSQSQRTLPESSTDSTEDTNGGDWQEEAYQKIAGMKEMYLPELSEMYQNLANKLHKEKLGSYEKQILNFIKIFRPKVEQQDQNASDSVSTEGQQYQPRPSQQKYVSDIQSQLAHMQQNHFYLQQQVNALQGDMQQRLKASGQVSGAMLQPPNTVELQNQLYQSHRSPLETSSTSLGSPAQTGHTDWLEEAYQKIKVMKHLYFAELSEAYWKIATKLQLDSHLQQQTSEQYDKLIMSKNKLEGLITVLHYSKNDISLGLKEKLVFYEKQIVEFINTSRDSGCL